MTPIEFQSGIPNLSNRNDYQLQAYYQFNRMLLYSLLRENKFSRPISSNFNHFLLSCSFGCTKARFVTLTKASILHHRLNCLADRAIMHCVSVAMIEATGMRRIHTQTVPQKRWPKCRNKREFSLTIHNYILTNR